jgi:hypothetical protein
MISYFLARLRFKATPPLEFEFEFHPVRVQSDLPDFKGLIVIDKFGNCSSQSPILNLKDAKLQSWNLTKSNDNSPNVSFVIAGRTFDVSEKDSLEVFNYFINTLPHLAKIDTQ